MVKFYRLRHAPAAPNRRFLISAHDAFAINGHFEISPAISRTSMTSESHDFAFAHSVQFITVLLLMTPVP
jgi:hypothetical protein